MSAETKLWQRYQQHLCICDDIGLTLDISRMDFDDGFFAKMEPRLQKAYKDMKDLEAGAIANPDEQRMVGHYWLRAPKLAPKPELTKEIEQTLARIKSFTADIHQGKIKPEKAPKFTELLSIGIGGSALGPEFVHDALGDVKTDKLKVHFFDNTDPDGMKRVLDGLEGKLDQTLCVVISKSGGTPETHNGMMVAADAYKKAGLNFGKHAVAVTGVGSKMDQAAEKGGWLARFPMWDWIGGRTSETSAVGLLPAALQGIDIDQMLAGAAACDVVTRGTDTKKNPAALLAAAWYWGTGGLGKKDMVVLPYKDRLLLLSRYLQQLVMESLGKSQDLDGKPVEQGIAVYGNKGSTDQHAYVQQLRDGVNNFYAVFIQCLEAGGHPVEVEPGVQPGDYLLGLMIGTRKALHDKNRESILISVPRPDAYAIGVLIALFERAVGFYGNLVNINAYHQPGVEAGKKAAAAVLELQHKLFAKLGEGGAKTAEQWAAAIGEPDAAETLYHILEYLTTNKRGVVRKSGRAPAEAQYAKG
ncbi:MAG: glucose-6-phosphate isomerase [Gemmataceae bacterium]|nr:glucose-6-phosphate isomerase [Gemmataceae bacterium]